MKINVAIQIAAPLDKVFDIFTDLETIEANIAGIQSVEVLAGSPKMEKGTKWKETRMLFGKEASETMTVSYIQKNEKYVVNAASHGTEYASTYTFDASSDGNTNVAMEFIGKPVSLMAKLFTPIGFLFKGATMKVFKADMEALKELAEATS